MWPFNSKQTLVAGDFFQGFTDYHSHILPGVDDGVQVMSESLEMLKTYEQCGVKSVWCTPHIMDVAPSGNIILQQRFEKLKMAYQGSVSLHLAAEYMLDSGFPEHLKEKATLLPIGPYGDHLLVETSTFSPPINFDELLDQIKARGYFPLLAHPERYVYMGANDYRKLKARGVKFQLNLLSLMGFYGSGVQMKAERLLTTGQYNFLGGDLHGVGFLDSLIHRRINKKYIHLLQRIK